jgi:DNA-binding NtrC family response regulator
MMVASELPRLLIIDDLFGRVLSDRRNRERAYLCGQYLIEDVTGDEAALGPAQRINDPIAQAIFHRGQTPARAALGDVVENDLDGVLRLIRKGWDSWSPEQPRWALVLLDLCFYTGRVTSESHGRTPGMPEGRSRDDEPAGFFGLRLLEAIHEGFPDLPVAILSSKSRREVSREFASYGAVGFLPRSEPDSPELLKEYIWRHGLIPDLSNEIVGHSLPLLLALRAARRAASERRNILIRGERGTGKELMARYIHRQSLAVQSRPYVVVDSGALSPTLYGSELFGHKRGGFTGADRDRVGRIVQASGGDLFLDEIANMPTDVQIGLLRVIEHSMVTPIGAAQPQSVDVRFLSATNEDLEAKAVSGGFRQDLLDRLREGGTIFLSPLRERLEDLDELVTRFVLEAEEAKPGAMARTIEPEAFEVLRAHDWPGNVRELRTCLYGAVSSYPDVEHMVRVHLRLGAGKAISLIGNSSPSSYPTVPVTQALGSLDSLITAIVGFPVEDIDAADWSGKFPELQEACALLFARLLKAALKVTRKPTPDYPLGQLRIHPAIKLLTGDKQITASKAADIIKRLLGSYHHAVASLDEDGTLAEAYEKALRLRPRTTGIRQK